MAANPGAGRKRGHSCPQVIPTLRGEFHLDRARQASQGFRPPDLADARASEAFRWLDSSRQGKEQDVILAAVQHALGERDLERVGALRDARDDRAAAWAETNRTYSTQWPNITRKKDQPADADSFKGMDGKFEKFFSPNPGG